jgi:CHAT domain-containing protein
LREQRLGPLAEQLKGARRLVVLPSPAMDGVPVEVIAEGVTVSYALSASLFAHHSGQARPRSSGLVALGDPDFKSPDLLVARGGWRALPSTRYEVNALQKLFAPEPTAVLFGSDASAARLAELAKEGALGKARYVHLATHGLARFDRPLASRIILGEDSELSAEQVLLGWDLQADMVVLSACQTGLGKHERGEGFVGFAQALMLTGARSVCLSRWNVNDVSTSLLMERFYQNLLGKRVGLKAPLGKAEALHEAKEWLRGLPLAERDAAAALLPRGPAPAPKLTVTAARPYTHPYFWAGFVLIGDPR